MHPQMPSFPSLERYSPGHFSYRPQTPQRSLQWALVGKHSTPAPKRTHSGTQGERRGELICAAHPKAQNL